MINSNPLQQIKPLYKPSSNNKTPIIKTPVAYGKPVPKNTTKNAPNAETLESNQPNKNTTTIPTTLSQNITKINNTQ